MSQTPACERLPGSVPAAKTRSDRAVNRFAGKLFSRVRRLIDGVAVYAPDNRCHFSRKVMTAMNRVIPLGVLFCLSASWAVADRPTYPRTVLEDRPIGYWRFEEAETRTKAENLGSQETALEGTLVDVTLTPESAIGELGQAAVFDRPTSRVELASKVSTWLNGTASLEFWIRTTQRGEGSWNAPAIFGADSNGDGNDLFWGTNFGGRIGVRRGDSGPAALTPEPINDNAWHHVVLTRDHENGVMKAYLDGRLVDTYHDAGRVPIKTTYGTMGQVETLPGQGQKFMATLDEVAVYDRVLAPQQVKRHWEAATGRKASSPLGSQPVPASPTSPSADWIALAPLVELDRDTRNASWRVTGDLAEFSAGKPRAYVSVPLKIEGSYELSTCVTIVRAKETMAIYLPVGGDKAVVLDMRGDRGNSESPTATIRLLGLKPPPEAKSDSTMTIGKEYALCCRVAVTSQKVNIEIRRDDEVLFLWSGDASQVTGTHVMQPNTLELETAYYTISQFRDLRLRREPLPD